MHDGRRLAVAALVSVFLSACAGQVTQSAPAHAYVRPAQSARVSFEAPNLVTTKITRIGTQYAPPRVNQQDMEYARRVGGELLRDLRSESVSGIEAALRNGGIPPGNDLHIKVFVDELLDTGIGTGAVLSVFAYYPDAPSGSTPWTVKIRGAAHGEDTKAAAAKLVTTAVDELIAAGIIARPKR